jgi:hypothetical protein
MRTAVLCLLLSVATASAGGGTNELTAKEITSGRKVYVAKCAKCHKFYEPMKYSEPDWGRWMDKMNAKSKLKPDQDRLLRRYLGEYRAGRIPKAK